MNPINAAIEEIESLGPGETFSYREIAKRYGVVCSTLTRRHKAIVVPHNTKIINQQKLTPPQELELVSYIEQLTARCLAPTREMVQNFASAIAKEPVSESWVSQFLNRYKVSITPHWSTGMDRDRHQADSEDKYRLFF
jgi:transposase